MTEFRESSLLRRILKVAPILLLYIAVFNEFDANYLNQKYLSFNFAFILIFYWTLKRINYFGYGLIFFAGIVNDVVTGMPLGLSSFSYMLLCAASSYLRSITLRPNIIKDWFFFLVTISSINSLHFMILNLVFLIDADYKFLLINNFFTFLLFFLFYFLFNSYYEKFIAKSDV
jgi:rod shape-determining protein MreD